MCLIPSSHSAIKPRLVECCSDGCPAQTLSHLHTGSLLWQSDRQVLGHLSYEDPSPHISQFGWASSPKNNPGCSKLLPFKNYGGNCALGNLQCSRILCSLPQICASTLSCLWALQAVPSTSWFVFRSDMHCQLHYTDRCVHFKIILS